MDEHVVEDDMIMCWYWIGFCCLFWFMKRNFRERQELEALADPMRKEVAQVRKRIDAVNKELKPLGHTCQKKVRFGGRNRCVDKHTI